MPAGRDIETFDYIIIGAGSAGCVLANRLSADPDVRVAVIEAGKKDNDLIVRMPAGVGELLTKNKTWNWMFDTEPQAHLDNRRLYWPRGKGWGGSSSINGMIYIRGHARDYDRWAQTGLKGWSFEDVLPYFKRAESYEGGANDFHGGDGPLWVSEAPMSNPLHRAFVQAGVEAGFPKTEDFNGAQQEGFGRYQHTVKDGVRWSASAAYLRPIVDARDNLKVISTGLVTRILIEDGVARGIEYVDRKGGVGRPLFAEREVLLCAGAAQSPQLLQLSGVGDPDHLNAMGVPVAHANPEVGRNLQDHLDVCLLQEISQPITLHSYTKGLNKLKVGFEYLTRRTGLGSEVPLHAGAFLKSRPGLEQPDLQLHMVNALVVDHGREDAGRDGLTVHVCQLRPESRGEIKLRSADPWDPPAIDPNYLATEEDRRAMREGVKMSREVMAQAAFDPYRGPEFAPGEAVTSDADIDAFIRRAAETIYHPIGTCRMGVDDNSVVDERLRVRGVAGLRVVDASVMPDLVSGNTNAPTIMIAEKASDMILDRAPLKRQAVELAADA